MIYRNMSIYFLYNTKLHDKIYLIFFNIVTQNAICLT